MIGYMSDRYSLQLAFVAPVVATALSSAILFYGMKFAPPIRLDSEPIPAGKT